MKKGIFIIIGLVVCFAAYIIYSKSTKKDQPREKEVALKISQNPDSFNQSIENALDQYYRLHDALVEWKPADTILHIADSLGSLTQMIPFSELKADTLLVATANNYASSITAEVEGMQADTAIKQQRLAFYTISENLFNLLRVVQYDRATIYHVKCPMAFNGNEEGFWLSGKREVVNPYFGKKDPKFNDKMLHCGSIEDSVSFNLQ